MRILVTDFMIDLCLTLHEFLPYEMCAAFHAVGAKLNFELAQGTVYVSREKHQKFNHVQTNGWCLLLLIWPAHDHSFSEFLSMHLEFDFTIYRMKMCSKSALVLKRNHSSFLFTELYVFTFFLIK